MGRILNNNVLLLTKAQEYKETLINEAIKATSVLRLPIQSRTLTSPPANPNEDDFYIVPAGATGAWANKTDQIAYPVVNLQGVIAPGQWKFYQPFEGLLVWVIGEGLAAYQDNSWTILVNSETAGNFLTKEVYDSNGDGIVDVAATVPNGAIGTAKLANGAVTTEKLAPGISIGVADGSITAVKLASNAVTIPKIAATGTPSNTTFLRGDGSWAIPAGGLGGGLETLTADRTYYVNSATGNDNNNGLTAGTAFATIQKAIDVAIGLILNGYTITVLVADGTYNERLVLKQYIGFGKIIIRGNNATPASCIINSNFPASGLVALILGSAVGNTYEIEGFTLTHTSTGTLRGILNNAQGSFTNLKNIVFSSGLFSHIGSYGGGVYVIGSYSITAGANRHIECSGAGAKVQAFTGGTTITLTGTPNFSFCFIQSNFHAFCYFDQASVIFSGAATGVRYRANDYGIISVEDANANYFPGNAGGNSTNGLYI